MFYDLPRFCFLIGEIVKYLFQQYGKGKSPSTGLLERYCAYVFFYFSFLFSFVSTFIFPLIE